MIRKRDMMYVVDGFEFQTKEEAGRLKESDGIRYIKDQTDMSDRIQYTSCI
ncbi:MAG: hypothetical protein ACLRI8_06375 [Agathobacter rectalis]